MSHIPWEGANVDASPPNALCLLDRQSSTVLLLVLFFSLGCGSKPPYEGKSVSRLREMLADSDPTVQTQAAFGLSLQGERAREAVPDLIQSLDRQPLVRQNAALALARIGPAARAAVPRLTSLLSDPEWPVRRQAALALGEIGSDAKSALPELRKRKNEPHRVVRQAIDDAIRKINRPSPR